jgi:hypothetical protein
MANMTAAIVLPTTIRMAAVLAAAAAILALAHVVTQGTTCGATGCGANEAATGATHTTADHVTARRAERATEGGFATAVSIRAHCAASRAAKAGPDGRAGTTAKLLAHYRAKNPTQGTAHSGFDGTAGKGSTASQAKGQYEYRGKLHEENLRLMTARS